MRALHCEHTDRKGETLPYVSASRPCSRQQRGDRTDRVIEREEFMSKRRIFVVEDQAAVREGIVENLNRETDLSVCGEADDLQPALTAIQAAQPDLVLTDLQLKSSHGIQLIRELRRLYPAMPIIAMTMFDPIGYERQARTSGATGFAVKQEGASKLIEAIRDALRH